ncbi:MAG: formimidoylglutamate deiminase, partial [Planctomycetota bacterium]
GQIAIGSDSNSSVSPVEELRWLEYVQRLSTRKRNVLSDETEASCGASLLKHALSGGAQACAQNIGAIATGCRADILFLDHESEQLVGKPLKHLLDSFIFGGNENLVRDVMTAGRWVVRDFEHINHAKISSNYRDAIKNIYQNIV